MARCAGLAFAGAMLLAAPASAAPLVTETFEYFDVSGSTAGDIRAQLHRLGPVDSAGRHNDAYTKWFVTWNYTYKNVSGRCAIATVSTIAKAVITFPRLKADAAAPSGVKQAFARYREKLLVHEKGHVQIGVDIANRVEDGIRALPPVPDCAALGRSANALGNGLIREGQRMDLDYDARTNHGATQGARFP